MKLYHAKFTRSTRPRWALEEIGVPYELVRLDFAAGDTRTPEYRRIHPHGKVPALDTGSGVMIESGAMVAWLADRFPEAGLAPAFDAPDRAAYTQWLFYAVATAEPPCVDFFDHTRRLPEDQRSPTVARDAQGKMRQVAGFVSDSLGAQAFLLGERFSAADVLLGSVMIWARSMKLLDEFPVILAWLDRCTARPAYQRARAE